MPNLKSPHTFTMEGSVLTKGLYLYLNRIIISLILGLRPLALYASYNYKSHWITIIISLFEAPSGLLIAVLLEKKKLFRLCFIYTPCK